MPDELQAIIDGLGQAQKTLSPKYFYDEAGSKLFERITGLPEYYLTETELGIMHAHVGEMAALCGRHASLIEFGAGSSLKTRLLLRHLEHLAAYVPVDISEDHLLRSQQSIQTDFPDIEVLPVAADFTQPFRLPDPKTTPRRNIVYFPGSTIGNFEDAQAVALLGVMHAEAAENGALLIGVDLQKDPAVIEAAYNDDAGVTAAFNLNMLTHLNREFGTDFDIDAFSHRASYDRDKGRVVMELVSKQQQSVRVGGASIAFDEGESIITEYSHKYTVEGFAHLAGEAGFTVERVWTDPNRWFSVQYCTRP